ncbi:MAG: topoisomerase IV [Oscillospiraceae bacterium]|jgi:DNA gyrase subunit A|nr:topoisomerase IV [Oscillospiraceae bacterium]
MAKSSKKKPETKKHAADDSAQIMGAGLVLEQPITDTIRENFMPYAISAIVSRAIPEIDGFKPSHRKLLYTMYKMGLLTGSRTKSANVVGQTMRLNPHGDQAIYETLVRLTRGNEALLHPYVDSKGNFGKAYSRDMAYAASRYTEVKLDKLCTELFKDIDRQTVDFTDNYDNTMKEPLLLPVTFPSVLVNSNIGIAVAIASAICPFNLAEVCEAAIEVMRDPKADLLPILKAPDFPGGGYILYDEEAMRTVCETGRGSIRVRARYQYDKKLNCIEITEIPPTTTVEAIIDKVVELVKASRIREIADIRDETDLSGLKITIDLKRGVDHEALMRRLFRMTPLEDTYSCNFNVLIDGMPRVCGVRELLLEWARFRIACVSRRLRFDLSKCQEKLHLLLGLQRILLDIDKAVRIIRETREESEVVGNLMIGFGIDEVQAEYVADIRLRHLNREYILNRTQEIEGLEKQIADLNATLSSERKIKSLIVSELKEVSKKHAAPRKSLLLYQTESEEPEGEESIPSYPVHLFFTKEGYFKKITPQSLRMSAEQRLKPGDEIVLTVTGDNTDKLLFFTDKNNVYKASAADFDDTKASVIGDYVPAKLGMEEGESVIHAVVTGDFGGCLLFCFANGKCARVPLASYETKTNRKKLVGAYCDKFPLVAALTLTGEERLLFTSTEGKVLLADVSQIPEKATRGSQGVNVMSLRGNAALESAQIYEESFKKPEKFMVQTLPGAGSKPRVTDYAVSPQTSLED